MTIATPRSILKSFVLILAMAYVFASASVLYERSFPGVVGNVCEATTDNPRGFCYENLPRGGFPFSYLYDVGGITGQRSLDYIEDSFRAPWFLADVGVYAVILWFFMRHRLVRERISGKGTFRDIFIGFCLVTLPCLLFFFGAAKNPSVSEVLFVPLFYLVSPLFAILNSPLLNNEVIVVMIGLLLYCFLLFSIGILAKIIYRIIVSILASLFSSHTTAP